MRRELIRNLRTALFGLQPDFVSARLTERSVAPRLTFGTTQRLASDPLVCDIAQANRARPIGPTLSPIRIDSDPALLTWK